MSSLSGRWRALFARWDHYLHATGSLWPLALFRIGWALAMLAHTALEATRQGSYAPGRFHLPLLSVIAPPSAAGFELLMRVSACASLLTLVGLGPRLASALLVAIHGYLLALDLTLFRNHVYLALLLGLLLASSPCGRALSLESVLRRCLKRPLRRHGSLASVQLIKLQVLIVYGWSALNKLRPTFLSGWPLAQELPLALPTSPLAPWLMSRSGSLHPVVQQLLENRALLAGAAWAVLLVELFLTFGLPMRRLRPWAILCGVTLHLSIYLLMNVFTFGCLMLASYVLFREQPEDTLAERGAGPLRQSRTSC